MQIQFNTDSSIDGREALAEHVTGLVEQALGHFGDQITRVEVHVNDEGGQKGGPQDIRCMMEARVENRPPTAVTHHAGSPHDAAQGAAEKLKRSLESTLGRLAERR